MLSSCSSAAPGTATTSAAKAPASQAAAALRCEARANSSWASRLSEYFSARTSAPSPSEMVHSAGMRGFTIRQPNVVFQSCSCAVGKPLAGLSTTHGARVMLSTPPATTTSASPTATARDPSMTASMPEPHSRFTVAPGTVTGKPASRVAIRATLRLSSPAPLASPRYTSSTETGSSARVAVEQRPQRDGGEVVGPHAGQGAAVAAHGRPDGVDDVGVLRHDQSSDLRGTSRRWTGKSRQPNRSASVPQMPRRRNSATRMAATPSPIRYQLA